MGQSRGGTEQENTRARPLVRDGHEWTVSNIDDQLRRFVEVSVNITSKV